MSCPCPLPTPLSFSIFYSHHSYISLSLSFILGGPRIPSYGDSAATIDSGVNGCWLAPTSKRRNKCMNEIIWNSRECMNEVVWEKMNEMIWNKCMNEIIWNKCMNELIWNSREYMNEIWMKFEMNEQIFELWMYDWDGLEIHLRYTWDTLEIHMRYTWDGQTDWHDTRCFLRTVF